MPYIRISTNVTRAAAGHVDTVLKSVSKSISTAMEFPEAYTMVEVETDRKMLFNATTEPCAFVNIRSMGKVNDDYNPKTVAAITETITQTLGVPKERVFININDLPGGNWGFHGITLGKL